jgi:hypothetical protein
MAIERRPTPVGSETRPEIVDDSHSPSPGQPTVLRHVIAFSLAIRKQIGPIDLTADELLAVAEDEEEVDE